MTVTPQHRRLQNLHLSGSEPRLVDDDEAEPTQDLLSSSSGRAVQIPSHGRWGKGRGLQTRTRRRSSRWMPFSSARQQGISRLRLLARGLARPP